MASIDRALLDFKRLDELAGRESALHRLDARAKVLTTLVFIICVISFPRYQIISLIPFLLFPLAMIAMADLPLGYLLRKIALLCPFPLLVGIFNPLFDRAPMLQSGGLVVTGGWLSCASIVLRAALTVSAAMVLIGVTGFPAICRALVRLGMPTPFAIQLLFLYRYIFVLLEEGGRASRARDLRSFGKKGQGVASYSSLLGHLLLRTWLKAERIHMAMLARGFTGELHSREESRFGGAESLFLLGWSALFLSFRLYNIPQLLGALLTGTLL